MGLSNDTDSQPKCSPQARGPPQMKNGEEQLLVLFDGDCPICSREITMYKKMDVRRRIDWIDVNEGGDKFTATGVTRASALRRFHALSPDGAVLVGIDGFQALWSLLPKTRYLAKFFSSKYARRIAYPFYELFAAARWFLRRGRVATTILHKNTTGSVKPRCLIAEDTE